MNRNVRVRQWITQAPLLLCLALMGCRFIGCGGAGESETGGTDAGHSATSRTGAGHGAGDADVGDSAAAPLPGRIVAPSMGAGLIIVPTAPPPEEFDDDADEAGSSFTFDADAEPTSGGAPLDVEFTLTIDDPPAGLTFRWDFGDGSPPVTVKSPIHRYRNAGEYTAVLTLAGPEIDETREFSIDVTEEGFDIDIEADPDIGPAPLKTKLSAVVPDDMENDVAAYEWTFGDGGSTRGKSAEHVYRTAGTYTLKLTVTHTNGQQGSKEIEIQVDEPEQTEPEGEEPTD
jgi:PKD repeat protein